MSEWKKAAEREAGSYDHAARPLWTGGVPHCVDTCPHHDGKRCRVLGFSTPDLCEPVVAQMAKLLDEAKP